MRRWLTIIVVTGLVLGAFTWGYSEWTNRQRLANALESDYQREFYSVLEQVEQLDPLLSKSLVASSSKQQVFYLTEIWSRATASQGALGQLPFLDINLSASRKFLAQMGDYAYSLAKQVAGGREMETEQRKHLQNFSRQVKEYTGTLRETEETMYQKNFRWTSAITRPPTRMARASVDEFQGFVDMEQRFQGLPVLIYDGPFSDHLESQKPKGLKGAKISRQEAEKNAERFANQDLGGSYGTVDTDRINGKIEGYSVALDGKNRPGIVRVDLSTQGGHVLSMLNSRKVERTLLGNQEAEEKAREFLEKRGFKNLVPTYAKSEDHTRIIVFVAREGEVRLYPDQIKVQVALDNGEVVGFDSVPYLIYHHQRNLPKPQISPEEAVGKLRPEIQVKEKRLALIPLSGGKEILTYELLGNYEREDYLIYINALTGAEENIFKLIKTAEGQLSI